MQITGNLHLSLSLPVGLSRGKVEVFLSGATPLSSSPTTITADQFEGLISSIQVLRADVGALQVECRSTCVVLAQSQEAATCAPRHGSMSSLESMSATLPPEHWGLETESMHERNYPCHTHIHSYFGPNVSLSGVGAAAFQKQLYLCMLAQGFERKAWIEAWCSSNAWAV
eukprot:COSAG01_NODE_3705_length_5777_cov_19.676118_3_plen_170_part_00